MKDVYNVDMFSIWDPNKEEINLFIEQANSFHPTVIFMAEISENETEFLVINCKEERLQNESILSILTHYKPTETFCAQMFSFFPIDVIPLWLLFSIVHSTKYI